MQIKKQHNHYSDDIKKSQNGLVLQYLPAVRALAYRLKERLPTSIARLCRISMILKGTTYTYNTK